MSDTYTFQAETQQLLDILIHSLYTEREIFLRELISNASDALNRIQFEQLTNADVLDAEAPLEVRIRTDEEAGTLTIRDTGIGMTREEIIENLGTIARSGAKNFMQAIKEASNGQKAQEIIGQFGVGFYSVFMAADQVRVISRSARKDAAAVAWEASGGTTYAVEDADKAERGTEIIITLKEDAKDFLKEWKLREIIKRHSDYIAFPIYLNDAEEPANQQTAIWRQNPREVSDEEYKNFYQMLTLDFDEPLHRIHQRADVPLQFYALLYFPGSAEPSMFSPRKEPGLKLYARKVLIQEYSKDLLPDYLQFIQGVVDSEDLPLNVNRESVRADRILAKLKQTLTSKVLSELKQMIKNEREQYEKVHASFQRFLKQGLVSQPQDRAELEEVIMFPSSHHNHEDKPVSLSDYVERMVSGQNEIYYVLADDFASARRSPHLDAFRQRGIEVLYFCDPVDAVVPMGLTEYRSFKLRAVDESDIDLKDVGETPSEEAEAPHEALPVDAFEALQKQFKAVLGERVKDVRESKTLVGSPARLVSDETGANRHMYRIQRVLDRDFQMPVKTLELNPRHPLVHNLSGMLASGAQTALSNAVIEQIFETALLQEGLHPDPAAMAARLTLLMQAATGSAVSELDFAVVHDAPSDEAAPADEAPAESPEPDKEA